MQAELGQQPPASNGDQVRVQMRSRYSKLKIQGENIGLACVIVRRQKLEMVVAIVLLKLLSILLLQKLKKLLML